VVALAPLVVFGTLAYFKSRETLINQVGERLQAGRFDHGQVHQ